MQVRVGGVSQGAAARGWRPFCKKAWRKTRKSARRGEMCVVHAGVPRTVHAGGGDKQALPLSRFPPWPFREEGHNENHGLSIPRPAPRPFRRRTRDASGAAEKVGRGVKGRGCTAKKQCRPQAQKRQAPAGRCGGKKQRLAVRSYGRRNAMPCVAKAGYTEVSARYIRTRIRTQDMRGYPLPPFGPPLPACISAHATTDRTQKDTPTL